MNEERMSAIEVLKNFIKAGKLEDSTGKHYGWDNGLFVPDELYGAIDSALLALEQKENQIKWLISCLKVRLDLCEELRKKDLSHYNRYIDIEIDFIYLSLERLGLNKSEIRKMVGEQK